MDKKVIKSSQASIDVDKGKKKAQLKGDIQSYFGERDKTNRAGSEHKEDVRMAAEAEADIKDLLYKESMKEVSLPESIEPLFNSLFLTARRNRVRTESGLLLSASLLGASSEVDYSETQVVLAHGPQVGQAFTGSEVVIDFESFRKSNTDTMSQKVNKESSINVPIITIDGIDYISLSERNLKYISKKVNNEG
tara:strand:+ start:16 stop:594 length:579 start_codon:yes stop_codon:yes gene_type:complete